MNITAIKELIETVKIYACSVGFLLTIQSNSKKRQEQGIDYEVPVDINYLPIACFACEKGVRVAPCPDWQYNRHQNSYCGHMQAAYSYCERFRANLWNDPLVEIMRDEKHLTLRWTQLTDAEQHHHQQRFA